MGWLQALPTNSRLPGNFYTLHRMSVTMPNDDTWRRVNFTIVLRYFRTILLCIWL